MNACFMHGWRYQQRYIYKSHQLHENSSLSHKCTGYHTSHQPARDQSQLLVPTTQSSYGISTRSPHTRTPLHLIRLEPSTTKESKLPKTPPSAKAPALNLDSAARASVVRSLIIKWSNFAHSWCLPISVPNFLCLRFPL